jgi:hypothetical protein
MFQNATRRKLMKLETLTKGTSNPLQWDIPKAGYLAGIYLDISISIAGTLSAPNALGVASAVRKVRLFANSGIEFVNLSGAGYNYLLRDFFEHYVDPVPMSNARDAVTTGAKKLHMWIPFTINSRDEIGLFPLQNEQTTVVLQVEFETDAIVATGATITGTVTPMVEVFTVPPNEKDRPAISLIQSIVEDSKVISGAGDYSYRWPRGSHYLQVLHGAGINQAPADSWSAAKLLANKSDYLADFTPELIGMEYSRFHGTVRRLGHIPIDLMGTSGLGMFGSTRDIINSANLTELETLLTLTGALTLYTVRRMLVPIVG